MQEESFIQRVVGNKRLMLALVIVSVLLLIALTLILLSTRGDDRTSGEYVEPYTSAFIVYKDSPYTATDSLVAEEFLKTDLGIFARENYKGYGDDGTVPVSFKISDIQNEGENTILLKGSFDKSKNPIEVRLVIKNNGRISNSIIDTETNKNMDGELPSNSPKNQFIGSLPIHEASYSVVFDQPDTITIQAYFRDPGILKIAEDKIKNLTDEATFNQLDIDVTYPTGGFLDE